MIAFIVSRFWQTESNRLNAFKTISMRIRGAKSELEEAGESTDGMVESTATLRREIMALSGVDIMLDKNTFKSTYQVMDELSKKWEGLSDIAQATIIELMAGKHQGNVFSSLMQNFDIAREALETSMNSSGSAMQEHEKWSQSLEAQLLKLKAAWQSLSQSFLKSDFLKTALNGIIGLVDGVNKLIDTFGTIPTLLGAFAVGKSLFGGEGLLDFDKDTKSVKLLGTNLIDLKGKYTQIQTAISRYNSLSSKSASFQEKYNKAMTSSSTSVGKYLSGLKGAKASFGGYIGSLVGATVKTIALEAATMLLNAALTMGISFAIQGLITLFDKLIVTEDELAEKVDEITSKFKDQHKALKDIQGDYDTTNESSMISRYEKLSKGVDNLGRNVSLTADEYSEYQSIVNSIAEQIPSLVSGYDEQGNALLSCKGNVDELTAAYEKLIHAQNQSILANTGDIEKDFANKVKDADGETWWGKFREWNTNLPTWAKTLFNLSPATSAFGAIDGVADLTTGNKLTTGTAKILNDLLNADRNNISSIIASYDNQTMQEIQTALKNAGVDVGFMGRNTAKALEETLKNEPAKIKGIVDNFYGELEETITNQKTIATAKLSEAFDVSSAISGLNYGNIGEDLQAVAYQVVNSFDYDFLSKLSESGKTVEQWTTEMLNSLNSISKADNAQIEAGFDLQTQFNGGDISYGEYVKSLQGLEGVIDNLNVNDQFKEQLKISVGLDEGGIVDEYNALMERLTDSKNYDFDISETEAMKLLDGLSSEELKVAVGVITDLSNNNYSETAEEIIAAIERELTIQGLTLDLSIDVEKTKLEALSTAITESFSGSGLSTESLSAIEGMFSGLSSYDPSKLFERTANGIRLNSTELGRLNSEYKKTNLAKINNEMDSLGDIYNQTREELYRLTYGTDEYNAKAAELSGIEERINLLEQTASAYEGLASAYQEWQMTEAAGSQRDMYESVIEGLENIDDEIKRGWVDDGTLKFLELLTGKDLSTAGIEEVRKAYKGLGKEIENTGYSVRDFFTVDEDGNSTNAGVYNFLDAINKLEKSKFGGKDVVDTKDGKIIGFNFQAVGGDKVIAEALGISEELVQIMVRAADDAGFVVSMDGTYQQLDILKEKAQEAAESLNQTLEKSGKEGFEFNFNSSNVDDIKNQLAEAQKILDSFRNADGTINTKLEGADEALTVASTLQSMLDKLTRPAYMEIEVSQVEDELREPLENLQEYRRLIETQNQLKLSGADTSELEASIEESKNKIVEDLLEIQENNPKLAGELKIEGLSEDEIEEKVEAGEISIPATVDIQLEMDDKLGILVDKALLDAGIITEEEFKKRVDIYLEADVDNEDAKNKTEKAVDEVDKNTESEIKTVKTKTKAEVEKTKAEVKTEIDNTKAEVESQVDSVKSDAKSKVESVKSDVENLKVEIANMEAGVESLSQSLQTLQEIKDDVSVSVDANLDGNVPYLDEAEHIDDLLIFAEGVKALQDLPKETNVSVVANLGGNIPYLNESEETDDLLMFAAGVEALKDLPKETNVSVTANLYGNVHDMDESKQTDDLLTFAAGVEALQNLESVDLSVNVSLSEDTKDILSRNEDSFTQDLQTLAKGISDLQNLTDEDVDIDVDISLSESTNKILKKNEGSFTQDLQTLATGINDLQGLNGVDIDIDVSLSEDTQTILGKNENSFTQDLQTLATGVSDLQDLKSVDLSIDVSFDGDTKEILSKNENAYIQDLQTLATGIDDLQNLQNVDASVNISLSEDTKDILAKNENSFIQDLQTLATGIDDLQGLTDVNAEVNVSLSEDTKEILKKNENSFTQDLQTLAAGIDDLQGLKGVDIDVDVALSDNTKEILKKNEGSFTQDLQTLATGINNLQNLKNVDLSVDVSLSSDTKDILNKNEDNFTQDLQTLATGVKALQNLQSVDADVDISLSEDTKNILKKNENSFIQDLQTLATGVKSLQGVADVDASVNVSVDGNAIIGDDAFTRRSALTEVKSLINGMSNQDVTISVKANVDSENVNKAIQLLKDIQNSGVFRDYSATVQVGATITTIDDTTVKNYKAPEKEGTVKYSVNPESSVFTWTAPKKDGVVNYSASVEALTNAQKYKSGTITYKAKVTGLPVVNGTANANGTTGKAYSQGNWGAKKTETALTGELGQELVVYGNRFWTVGDNGAEFTTIPKGAIVFNHKQTEEIFKNGRVTSGGGRGKVYANGTAFAQGTAFVQGSKGEGEGWGRYEETTTTTTTTKKTTTKSNGSSTSKSNKSSSSKSSSKSSTSSKSSSSKKAEDEFEETIDWIEVAIDRIERAIDQLDKRASNVYKSWSSRNGALESEISKVGDEIELQQAAYERYLQEANSVGLSSDWAKKVREGKVDIETIKDEALAEKIKEYQQWYEKALDCKEASEDLKETESKLYAQRFENIQTQYDGILQGYEHTETMLNEYVSQAEEQGFIVSKKYYQALIDNEKQNINQLKKEQSALIKARDEAVASGAITKGSQDWYDMCADIDAVTQAIEESTTALLEFDNAIRDIDWQVFDLIQERISDVAEEADFFIELMSNKKLFEDDGKLTSRGLATMGLHAQNYNTHMYQADEYGAEIANLDEQITKDPYDQELINRRQELVELQRESILAAEDEKNAIRDMVEEGINLELDALQELIDKKNEALESERDLYEYQKKVKEQTEEIASLEKQMAAYENDDSEEAKAKIQELRVSLSEAEDALKETEWDKYIQDTQQILDSLYSEYELILNTRLDNIDYLLEQVIESINTVAGADGAIATALGVDGAISIAVSDNATSIKTTLGTEAKNVGVTLSDAMNSIWSTGEGNAKSVLTMYGEDFRTKSTTVITTLNGIKVSVNNMVAALNKEATKKTTANKTSTSAKKDPTKTTTTTTKKPATTTNKTKTTNSSGDGKAKVGDKVKFVSGQYYYDSQGKKPLGSHNLGKYVYITKVNDAKWATHPYHISTGAKLGKGDLGWLKLNQLSGYASGKRNFLADEVAWTQEDGREFIIRPSDGAILTPVAKGDSVLTSAASRNIWDMANSPAEFIKDNLSFGGNDIPNNSNVQSNYIQNLDKVVFNLPNVKNYEELLASMQKDRNFEKLIHSMTVDRLVGKSSLAKGKSIR